MTWKHLAGIGIAFAAMAICGHSPSCAPNMHDISTLATLTVGGLLGHATSDRSGKRHDDVTKQT